jgi:hypothetical protein
LINPAYLKKAVIDILKADSALVAALGNDASKIKESQFQGQDFEYPAIRVDMQLQTPIGSGTDRTRLSYGNWTIRVFSSDKSSQEADNLLGLVINALFDKQKIGGTDLNNNVNFNLVRINIINTDPAFRVSDRLWMGTAVFEGLLNIVSPP